MPDDVAISKGGTVNFVVNGGGHGIAIHAVSKKTTRADIAEDLCQGGTDEADRAGRAVVCNGTVVTPATIDGVSVLVTGTQNLDYTITDGKGHITIQTGFNTGTVLNPRVDDPSHGDRLLATSGAAPGDSTLPGQNTAGAFLTGSTPPATPGNRVQVQFLKSGRYLVICMNRAHFLNDHEFGFVDVAE